MSRYPRFFARDLGDAEKGGEFETRSKIPNNYRDGKEEKAGDVVEEDYRRQLLVSPYSKYVASDALIWALYLEEAEAEDRELMDPWSKNLDSLLVFAGLFAAILTAFLIESRKELFEDPQTQLLKEILVAMRNTSDTSSPEAFTPEGSFLSINGLWFTSLTLTLSSALGGVLSKGWIATHSSSSMRKTSNDAFARHLRSNRIRKWRVGTIISIVSLLIQIALFLFFVGLVLIVWSTDETIKFTILALVSITALIYLVITFLPWIFPACPLQTPITEGTPWIRRPDVYGQRGRSLITPGGTDRGVWEEVTSLYEELRSIPKPQELEAQILAWVISNTLDKRVLTEALKALAGVEWTQELRTTLNEYGALSVLRTRLPQYLSQARMSGDSDEEWTCILLYLMLQIELGVREAQAGERSPFEPLLKDGGTLHRWQSFRPDEQPLACSLRLHILMDCDMDESDTAWQGDILGLVKVVNEYPNSSMKNILFHTATRGVSTTKENLRRMCGVIMSDLLLSNDIESLSNQLERSNRGTLGDNWRGNYQKIPQVLCKLCLDEDSGIREGAIEALVRMSADDQLCAEFEGAFEELVVMRNKDHVPATLAVTAALAQNDKLRNFMKRGMAVITQGVQNAYHECWEGSVNASMMLARCAEMQPEIRRMIPGLAQLMILDDRARSRVDCMARSISVQDVFEPQIKMLIKELTVLLDNGSDDVKKGVIRIIEGFAKRNEFHLEVKAAVQKVTELHSHSSPFIRRTAMVMIQNLSTLAGLQLEIRNTIPQIIELLSDNSDFVRKAAIDTLYGLAPQAEFQLDIKPAIPKLIELFTDPSNEVHTGAMRTIVNFAGQTPLQYDIKAVIPNFVRLFSHGSDHIRKEVVWSIHDFALLSEFHSEVEDIIPKVIEMRGDNANGVRISVLQVIESSAGQAGLHSEVKASIPKVTELLNDKDQLVQRAALRLITGLSKEAEFQLEIKTEIPKIAQLLGHKSESTHFMALQAINHLAMQIEFQPEVSSAISHALGLLDHKSETIRGETLKVIPCFVTHTEFQPDVAPAIQRVIELLSDSSKWIRSLAVNALHSFACQARFRSEIKATIPKLVAMLTDTSEGARKGAVDTIKSLVAQSEFRTEIKSAAPKIVEILSHEYGSCRAAAVGAIKAFSGPVEFQSEVKAAMPKIIQLLADEYDSVRLEAVRAFQSFSMHAGLQAEVIAFIPNIVQLLADRYETVRQDVVQLIMSFAAQDYSQHAIKVETPNIIQLLTNRLSTTRHAGLEAIRSLSTHIEQISGFDTIAPVLMNWLNEHDSELQAFAVTAICTLVSIDEFRSDMVAAPQVILSWLTFRNMGLRITALNAIRSLVLYDQYHTEIQGSSMQIAGLLGDQYVAVRMACVELLCSPRAYEVLAIKVQDLIPRVTELLADVDQSVRSTTAKCLVPLAQDVAWHSEIKKSFSHYRFLLMDAEADALKHALNPVVDDRQ